MLALPRVNGGGGDSLGPGGPGRRNTLGALPTVRQLELGAALGLELVGALVDQARRFGQLGAVVAAAAAGELVRRGA